MAGGSPSEWKVRILHISDLHERGPRENEPFLRRRVFGDAWKRHLDELLKDGAIDLVCFTGDIADWGKPSEYGPATDFIHALLHQLSLPIDRLFLIPGNHDIDRDLGKNAWAELRGGKDAANQERKGKLSRVPRLGLSRWMAGGASPLGLEGASREELLSRQSAYRAWVTQKLGRPGLVPAEKSPHPFLGYRQTLRLPGHPFDIHLVGLDSSWLAGDDNDNGKLLLTTDQVHRLTTEQGERLAGFRLALIHHPLSDLADKDDCQQVLADNVDLLLRGHLHNEAVETWESPNRVSRQLAAGCLYEGHHADQWPNACHVITATLDDQGHPLRYDLLFRSWSPRGGHWHNDNSLYEGTKDGRLTWWIGRRPAPPPLPPTDLFVGREEELKQLKEVLLPTERRPVAICAVNGMPGVGKSYLAAHFAQLHAKDFPGGCARLVLNPLALQSVDVLLGELGTRLELPAGAQMEERCRERMLHPLSLLILENVDSREATDLAVQLADALQGCPLIVTGRHHGLSSANGWKRIEVRTLDEPRALELLQQELGPEASRIERAKAETLVHTLGRLPLAIHLAAGYLRASHSVESFLTLLKEKGLDLEPVYRNDPLFREDKARAIIRSTFELSLGLLKNQLGGNEKAERWLAGFGELGHAPLSGFGQSLGAAIAGLSEQEFRELAAAATALSLLSRVPVQERKDDAWRVHPLLAELLRRRGEDIGLERMTKWFVARLPELPSGQEQRQGERWSEVHHEINGLADWLLRVPAQALSTVQRAGSWFAINQGPFPAWVEFCERALKGELTPDERSNFLWTLGNAAIRAGFLARSLSAATEKLTIDLERGDQREAALASGLHADIFQARGQLDEALRIRQQEELPVYERLGDVHSRAATLGKVADILQMRGQLDEALRTLQQEALPAFERLGDVRSRAATLGKVADILQARGQLDEALRTLQQEQLPVYERLGDVHSRAVTLGKVADILQARGQLDEALRIRQQEELPVYERLGDVHSRAATLGKVADILQMRGQLDEALRTLQQEALPAFERLGDVRSRTVTLGQVADILQKRGQLDEALRIRQQEELPVYERLGDVHSRAATLGQVADILQMRGQLDEALRTLQQEALPAFERLGDVRSRAVALGKVADILQKRGQLDEALRIRQQEQLPVYERLGDVLARAVTLLKVAMIFDAQGQHDHALKMLQEQVLPVFERLKLPQEQEVTQQEIAKLLARK